MGVTNTMITDFSELLKQSEGVTLDDSFENVPDGEYIVTIEEVALKETKETKKLMLTWNFIVDDEDDVKFNGRHIWKNQVLSTPQDMKRAVTDLSKFDVDTTSTDSILAALPDLTGYQAHLKVTTSSKGYTFVNIVEVL